MNTEQVVEMIDAITEGRPYALVEKGFTLDLKPENFTLFAQVGGSSFDDSRTAREIAGALIAWANRKEGNSNEIEAFRLAANYLPRKSGDV